jgi:hypothetical protein
MQPTRSQTTSFDGGRGQHQAATALAPSETPIGLSPFGRGAKDRIIASAEKRTPDAQLVASQFNDS